jgi:ribonuclease D
VLDREPSVAAFLARLRSEAVLAVDLEADSLHSYREQVCLVQVSTPSQTAILDPLAVPGALAGLGPALADRAVRKVFHGGDYDVRLLKRQAGLEVRNLFDTMIAAQLTGRERFGLAALLEEHFGVTLDKRFQRADWSRRPLGPDLLAYAAADTAHLLALADRLSGELAGLGRLDWAREEFELLEQVEPAPPRKPWCLDVKGAARLAPRQLARLQGLLELRDDLARDWNRPAFKVLSNQILIDWAQAPPASRHEVAAWPGAGGPLLERVADRVLEALARAAAVADEECPRPQPAPRVVPTPAQERRLSRLKAIREEAARRLRLAPGLLVNGATLERLSRAETGEAVAALPGALKRWQFEVLGEAFQRALAPEL